MKVMDETASDLRRMIERDFSESVPEAAFVDKLIDWLHFRARLIPKRPRIVNIAPTVQHSMAKYEAIGRIATALRLGHDVSPWLSNSVRKRKTSHKADMMFNDWGISHFHVGNFFEQRESIRRTRHLLFAHITAYKARIIGIFPHGAWGLQDIVRLLYKEHPDLLEGHVLDGVLPGPGWSDDELLQLRQTGGASYIVIDGKAVVSPGLGIATSGHSVRIVKFCSNIRWAIRSTIHHIERNELPPSLIRKFAYSLDLPIRLGVRFEQGEFIVFEKERQLDLVRTPPLQ